MFERQFEFTVHHPLAVCEKRIRDMEKSGCLTPYFVFVHINYLDDETIEAQIEQSRRGYLVKIEARIEYLDDCISNISGQVFAKGYERGIVFFSFGGVLMTILPNLLSQEFRWEYLIFPSAIFWLFALLVFMKAFLDRNGFLKKLEETLTKTKEKKKRA